MYSVNKIVGDSLLNINLQKFAENVGFVEINIDKFLEKYNSTNPNNQLKDTNLYFVYMNTVSEPSTSIPYMLFKGKNLIGNSGSIIRQSTNGMIPFNGVGFSLISPKNVSKINLSHRNIVKNSISILLNTSNGESKNYVDLPINTNALDFNNLNSDNNKGFLILENNTDTHLGNINYITGEISNISGDIVSASDTDLIAKYNFLVNIEEYATISSNLRGFPGQTLFIIDKFEGVNGLQQVNTYMYFWDESVKTNSGDIQIKGQWRNANLNLVSQLSIKNLDFSVDDLKKLKGLLANNDLFAN